MKSRPWYGSLVLAIAVLALSFFFYFKPKDRELKTVRADRVKLEQEVKDLKLKKLELDKIEAELVSMKKILKELEVIIPQKREISDILRRIQQLAFDARLDILKFAPRGETPKEFYAEWPIPIEISGNYHNLATFFDRLSNFSRIFNIENFTIRASQKQTDAVTVSSSFTAKTYYFLEEPPPAPTPKAQPR